MAVTVSVTTDLIFSSRISGAAAVYGVDCRSAASADAVASFLDDVEVGLVLVDMTMPRDAAAEAVRTAAAHRSKPTVVAYYPHVQADMRDTAKQAGADQVWARSRFVEMLPELFASLSSATSPGATEPEARDT